MINNYINRYIKISTYKYYKINNEDIAEKLGVSVATIRLDINTKEYKKQNEINILRLNELKNKENSVRTRLLVETLLATLEQKVETAKDPLQYLDDIKKLSDITGIASDTKTELNVVEIVKQLDIEEFNKGVELEEQGSTPKLEANISVEKSSIGTEIDHPMPQRTFSQATGGETPTLSQKYETDSDVAKKVLLAEAEETLKEEDIWSNI